MKSRKNNKIDIGFEYNEGLIYYKKGDFEKAATYFNKINKAVRQGHEGALLHLGHIYDNGLNKEENPALAARYYRKAAELGNETAKRILGRKEGVYKQYQYALLRKNAAEIYKIISLKDGSIIQEVETDLKELKDPSHDFHKTLSLALTFLEDFHLKQVIKFSQDACETTDKDAYIRVNSNIIDTLNKLNFKKLDNIKVRPLLVAIINNLAASGKFSNLPDDYNNKTLAYLSKVFNGLSSANQAYLDPYRIYQCASLIIKNNFGSNHEASKSKISLDELIKLIKVICENPGITIKSANKKIGKTLIIENHRDHDMGNLLIRLQTYLNENTKKHPTSIYLARLDQLLKSVMPDGGNLNSKDSAIIINKLFNFTKGFNHNNKHSLFTIKEPEAIEIYQCLSEMNLKKLDKVLSTTTEVDNDSKLKK